jgi:hypothetical protein
MKRHSDGENWIIDCKTLKRLHAKLEFLKKKLAFCRELQLVWMPGQNSNLAGEVRNHTVYIYEQNEVEAMKILVHEVVDYSVSQAIEPYKEVANSLIKIINGEAYKKKETVVETISKLFIEDNEFAK